MVDITLQVEKTPGTGNLTWAISVFYIKKINTGKSWRNTLNSAPFLYTANEGLNICIFHLAQKIVLILKYLAAEHDTPYGGDEMLFEILHFDWFHIPAIEIAKLSIKAADKRSSGNAISFGVC